MKSHKAVSEVLGYILILSVVVATITVIYAAGMPAVRSQQDIAVFRSMENTFYILQNVERLVAYNITPEKAVTVRAEGGSIAVIPDFGWINIIVRRGPSGHPVEFSLTDALGHPYNYSVILYITKNNKAIILDNGAILECYGSRCFLVSKPRFLRVVDSNNGLNLYFSLINISGRVSFAGYKALTFKNLGSFILNFSDTTSNSPLNLTIQIDAKKAESYGLSSVAIEKALLQYINKTLFEGKAKTISDNTIEVVIKEQAVGHTDWLHYSYLNLTIGYYNIKISG